MRVPMDVLDVEGEICFMCAPMEDGELVAAFKQPFNNIGTNGTGATNDKSLHPEHPSRCSPYSLPISPEPFSLFHATLLSNPNAAMSRVHREHFFVFCAILV